MWKIEKKRPVYDSEKIVVMILDDIGYTGDEVLTKK